MAVPLELTTMLQKLTTITAISGEGVIGVGMTSTTDAVVFFAMDSGNE